MVSRRDFLIGAAAGAAFGGLAAYYAAIRLRKRTPLLRAGGFGPLTADPAGILDLPEGFSYRIVARAGEVMADGLLRPGRPDGMACFPHQGDEVILVCNHELDEWPAARAVGPFAADQGLFANLPGGAVFDAGTEEFRPNGGTTTLVYNAREHRLVRQFLSLAGTVRNCAGGRTPRRSWLSCEEYFDGPNALLQKRHGYVFEVPASPDMVLAEPVPLTAMGRFIHEAAATDPETGNIYLTEDQKDGLLYRFLPNEKDNLRAGGILQALALADLPSAVTHNRRYSNPRFPIRQALPVRWITLENVDPDENDLRLRGFAGGAAQFCRGEGLWFGADELFIAATDGGPDHKGQIWRFLPRAGDNGMLELYAEPDDDAVMNSPDNLVVAPWGDLVFCEDGSSSDCLRGLTPEGKTYDIARNDYEDSEFAGACFSPDGSTLFVNLQDIHLTLAITGPWNSRKF